MKVFVKKEEWWIPVAILKKAYESNYFEEVEVTDEFWKEYAEVKEKFSELTNKLELLTDN